MPKKDFSQVAFDVVQKATGQAPKTPPTPTKKAASQLPKDAVKKPAENGAAKKAAPQAQSTP